MRKIYFSLVCAMLLIVFATPVKAQVHVNLGVNISSQPIWGPAGYDEAQCYYLPDIETYYYVPSHRFYFLQKGRWINSPNLPPRYKNYDLYGSYKVVVNEPQPWKHHATYRDKYASFKGRHDQQPIRDSHDSKYFVNKNHPEHNNWLKQQQHDKGNRNGQSKGDRNGGNPGDRGNIGNQGHDRGFQGDKGNIGNKGHDKGNPGDRGNTGNKGHDKGNPGDRGNTGNKGHDKGNPGDKGNTDNKGRDKENNRPQ
jgi:hypothetical protein